MTRPEELELRPEPRQGHRCCCVVIAEYIAGRCPRTAPPDAPFCDDCEARHPGWEGPDVTVSAVAEW